MTAVNDKIQNRKRQDITTTIHLDALVLYDTCMDGYTGIDWKENTLTIQWNTIFRLGSNPASKWNSYVGVKIIVYAKYNDSMSASI